MSNILDKIAKVLNQAENASTAEERDTFYAHAQSLSSKYSIDLAVARAHTVKGQKREEPVKRTMSMPHSVGRNTKKPLIELYYAIAKNNDVQINIAHDSSYVISFGFPSDIDMVDALFAHISMQMIQAADEFLRSGAYKTETVRKFNNKTYQYEDKPIDGRVARSSFYRGFRREVGRRMADARAEQIKQAEEQTKGTELVLADKSAEVWAFHKRTSTARGSWGGSSGGHSRSGDAAGRSAGASAKMGGQTAMAGARKALA